eukprot:scaffold6008_cov152-Skeletonema_marinoi.AAC.1
MLGMSSPGVSCPGPKILKVAPRWYKVGTSTLISALPFRKSALSLSQQQPVIMPCQLLPSKARRASGRHPIRDSALFDFDSSTSLSLHHPSTSTCTTIALFASMRRPLLFSPTALYPGHGLSAVTCRRLHLPSL